MQDDEKRTETGATKVREPATDGKARHEPAREETKTSKEPHFVTVPSLPAPTLPKGGGAIRGMGEKFQMASITGTGSMSVPLALSPGRGGMGPSVALTYDSGAGNGPFGIGWTLSVPAIRRKTDKGLPRYSERFESDTFILSGAEDLVPALEFVASEWRRKAVAPRNGETIERFRPRVEGLFARIERHKVTATGNVYWVTVTKDNVTSIYGRSANARVANPDFPSEIFEWLLEATYDDKGNVVYYEYKVEDRANVPAEPHERHRTTQSVSAQRYLKKIHYGNTTMRLGPDLTDSQIQSNTWLFDVVFDYGEHDATVPTPSEAQTWPARQDPFSSYKSRFEVRTYRLCKRVLMFHDFAELGTGPILVRSTEFGYSEGPVFSYLASVTQKGWIKDGSTYTTKSLPPVEMEYQLPVLGDEVKLADPETRRMLPGAIDGRQTRWVDLDGDGIAGLLSDEPGGALVYRRNLGGAALAGPRVLVTRPTLTALSQGTQQLLDLDSDGRLELVDFQGMAPGYYERTKERDWGSFVPFKALPILNWTDKNLQFLDLNGDGFADILKTEGDRIVWYPSKGKDGFDAARVIPIGPDERRGPAIVFDDGEQAIHVADMSGDGLADLVRIRNGEVSYWPNLGYGKFGGQVVMSKAPWFDNPDQFDSRRIHLYDVDGSGTTDIAYIGSNAITLWFNQSGNSLSPGRPLLEFLPTHDLASITFADFLGTGTGCLVWFSTAPSEQATRLRYVDLLSSRKPHVLFRTKNNFGLTTTITYASSTKFYLEDKAAGIEWVTRLAFPVHVVERVETYDAVTKQRFVSTYRYRHGYYDGPEREFRGFGYVEQSDAERYSKDVGAGDFPDNEEEGLLPIVNDEFVLPPVVTKTWFHTGAWKDATDIAAAFQTEYYQGDTSAAPLPKTVLSFTAGTVQEEREGARALKGSILRQEIYAEDGTDLAPHPFSVSERSYEVKRLQPAAAKTKHGVYFTHAREVIDYHYERNPSDPRVQHAFTLEVDDFGNVRKSAAIGYPRRHWDESSDPNYPPHPEQRKLRATLSEITVENVADEDLWYRASVPIESKSYELTGLTAPSTSSHTVLSFSAVSTAASSASEISYETVPTSGYQKRLLSDVQAIYFKDDLSDVLGLDAIESKALLHHTQTLALTGGLVSAVYDTGIVTSTLLTNEAKLTQVSSDWWAKSPVPTYDAGHFYLVTKITEPFGNRSAVTYDGYDLLPTETHTSETTAALDNVTVFENDYRVLSPSMVTDPNENRTAVLFDELGMVVKMAVLGKASSPEGDTLSDPTAYFEYDLTNWMSNSLPVFSHGFARVQHGGTPTWRETLGYTAGNGKEVLRKVQAEPDPVTSDPRWVGNGRTVWDNKGNPIKQYEPYFAADSGYDLESDLASSGVTPIMRYDALSRLVRTDFPNGTFSRVVFDPWKQTSWDPNDTVFDSEWYDTNHALSSGNPMRRAADLTEAHAGTPTLAHADSLGRTFLTQADNGSSSSHVYYNTKVTLDVQGNTLAVIDARSNTTLSHTYCPTGVAIETVSAEGGASQALYDVAGVAIRAWNSRDVAVRTAFDELRRPTHLYVKIGSATEFLAQRTLYGEGLGSGPSVAANLRGRVYRIYDSAGVITNVEHDFKGNLLEMNRVLAIAYQTTQDWSDLASLTDYGDIETEAADELEGETFTQTQEFDALNRVTSTTLPDDTQILFTYNEASFLEAVDVKIRGLSPATPFVRNIDYNARGQRTKIEYAGSSAAAFTTEYEYDPMTFRLSNQTTTRTSDNKVLQDFSPVYDPVGNIVEILDDADQTLYFTVGSSTLAGPGNQYEYDAIYRLVSTSGREHPGQQMPNEDDSPLADVPHPNDSAAMRLYTEDYEYDQVGNILAMLHTASSNNWNRHYTYASGNNKLETTELPGDPSGGPYTGTYDHDARGNMTSMPHLSSIGWDYADRMQSADKGGGGIVYFTYDSSGQRLRKVWDKTSTLRDERIYLGAYEIFRRSTSGDTDTERQTVHVMDDVRRIAMVETLTIDGGDPVTTPAPWQRYELSNQIDSASVELTEEGDIISYEEYFPFGATSFHSASGSIDVSAKRYRYTGKERDEETALYYYGARYYAPWLGRWASVDPKGLVDGPNLYAYVRNNPISKSDPTGTQEIGIFKKPPPSQSISPAEAEKLFAKYGLSSAYQHATAPLKEGQKYDFEAAGATKKREGTLAPLTYGEAFAGAVLGGTAEGLWQQSAAGRNVVGKLLEGKIGDVPGAAWEAYKAYSPISVSLVEGTPHLGGTVPGVVAGVVFSLGELPRQIQAGREAKTEAELGQAGGRFALAAINLAFTAEGLRAPWKGVNLSELFSETRGGLRIGRAVTSLGEGVVTLEPNPLEPIQVTPTTEARTTPRPTPAGPNAGLTAGEILRTKRGSIRSAPLEKGSPSWDQILDTRWEEIERRARADEPGYRTIRKLLTDRRFNR